MKKNLIFVTGFLGAPIEETARQIADDKGYDFLSLDDEIVKEDGRSILRICMMMGEHEYRNKEYEMLQKIADSDRNNLVICCSDGVLHNDMSQSIINEHTLIIVGRDMSCNQLWQNASESESSYHAFLHFGTEKERREAFNSFYERQCEFYSNI